MFGRDFYVEEPALAKTDEVGTPTVVMIRRWFMRENSLWADVNPMRIVNESHRFIVDETVEMQIPLTAFSLSIEEMRDPKICSRYDLPSLEMIEDLFPSKACTKHADHHVRHTDNDKPRQEAHTLDGTSV